MRRGSCLILAAVLWTVSPRAQQNALSASASWPHWRGPSQNGVAQTAAPTQWNDSQNVAWKVPIEGRGHSTPIVWGDRLFLTTAVPTGRQVEPPPAEQPAGPGGRGGRGGGRRGGDSGAGANQEHRLEVI